MEPNEVFTKEFRKTKLLALALLVAAPITYLIIAIVTDIPLKAGGEHKMLFYILLIVSVVQPSALGPIEKFQIRNYRRNLQSIMNPAQLFTTINILKFAMIEAIYIFGLIVYLASGNLTGMLVFFPVGIVWSYVYWPNGSTLKKFQKNMEGP